MADRSFTAKAMAKVLGYSQFGKHEAAKAWLGALLQEIDPQGQIAKATPALAKDEDIEYLAERGYWPKLVKGE